MNIISRVRKRLHIPRTIASKISLLNIVNVVIFSVILLALIYSFQQVRSLIRRAVQDDLEYMASSSRISRKLTRILTGTHLMLATFYENQEILEREGADLLKTTGMLIMETEDLPLIGILKDYQDGLRKLTGQCLQVNGVANTVTRTRAEMEQTLAALEREISTRMIGKPLRAEETTSLSRLIGQTIQNREQLREASTAFARIKPLSASSEEFQSLKEALEGIRRSRKAFAAAAAPVARLGSTLMQKTESLQHAYGLMEEAIAELQAVVREQEQVQKSILSFLDHTDEQALQAAGTALSRAEKIQQSFQIFLLLLSAGIIGLSAFFTYRFHKIIIRGPMERLRLGINAMAAGNLETRISLEREDEWRQIEEAVNVMAADLKLSMETVEREAQQRRKAEEELKHSEERLLQAQKLESIGRLASGVAHDFNNLLTAIYGYTTLIGANPDLSAELQAHTEEIRRFADRASTLIRQLLAFSRKQILRPEKVELNDLIRKMLSLLQRLIGEKYEVESILEEQAGCILADPGQVEQVIMNLVVNARDAMPHGGRILIATEKTVLSREICRGLEIVGPDTFVALKVADTGCGIDPAIRKMIFEPFFTTKEEGRGTGLGLSTVYGIVKQSGGAIEVESEPAHGTLFTLYFPWMESDETHEERAEGNPPLESGSESLVLVEDEVHLRKLLSSILQRHGYRVAAFASAPAAFDAFLKGSVSPDLWVSDVVMPDMNGTELAAMVLREDPHARILLISGYTSDYLSTSEELIRRIPLLKKPFTPQMLTRAVRSLLDGKPLRGEASLLDSVDRYPL